MWGDAPTLGDSANPCTAMTDSEKVANIFTGSRLRRRPGSDAHHHLSGRAWHGDSYRRSSLLHSHYVMHSYIRPNTHLALRLPSGLFKIVEITPNTYVA